ncbi:MAG: hypothetical protein IJT96_02910 [Lachnospiraceae bacterium]|nr:hypothetical protein [Lachnospiraceae bacterium]
MTVIQILLLIAGAVIFALGFFIPEGKAGKRDTAGERKEYSDRLKEITENELKDASRRVRDIVDEEVALAHDNSARSLEKITNEKIMAINDYGKTVTDEIERNHKEVVFMYDMLNDKTTDLKNTIRKYESMKKAPAAQEKPKTSVKTESGDNIHIPKMFAAPKGDKGKTGAPKSASDDVVASVVGGKYGQDVLRLHKEGMSDIDIAKKLGIGVGEVKLAVSLSGAGGSNEP